MTGQLFLKRYKVVRPLDEGGMSKVYLGMGLDRPREVAIKVLKDALAGQPKVREHFKREIFILSRFQHPNVVALLDADGEAKLPFYVMEYLRGVDLLRLLERNRRLSPERAGRLLGQMCAALHAAHEDGIVHRDVKPANFMIVHPDTPHEQVKLMDFGLAKMSSMLYISPEELINLRRPTASGTPEYISPEQVRGNDVDRRSDVYSLGVVLYEMLTGRRPFQHEDVQALLLAHSDEPPPSFASAGVPGLVPPAIEALVRSCLAKYPEERPQTVEEVALRYEELLGKKIYAKGRPPAPATQVRPGELVPKLDRALALGALNGAASRNAVVQHVTATMPESMAMLKLKGFIHDLGGEIVESVPGLIRVRLGTPAPKRPAGLLGWLGGSNGAPPVVDTIEMELQMEKGDPAQANRLSITLKLTPTRGLFGADVRARCERIGRDLQAYLIGR